MAGGLSALRTGPRRRLAAAGIVACLLLVGCLTGWFGVRLYRSIGQLRAGVDQASAMMAATGQLVDAVRDAETSQRGYLLTMQPSYLEQFWDSRGIYDRLGARLQDLASSSPEVQKEIVALREAVRRKMTELDDTVGIAMRDGQKAALAVVMTDTSQRMMASIRQHASRIGAISLGERYARAADLVAEERRILTGILAAAAIGVALLAVAALVLLLKRGELISTQRALELQSSRLRGVIERLPEGIALFDAQDRLLLCNAAFCPATGIAADRLEPGTSFQSVMQATADWEPRLTASHPGAEPRVKEVHRDGRTLDVWRAPMPDGGQILAVADVTRRVQAEAIARQSQRIESLGQLTGGVAHDFNNLLQVVSANLELADARPDLHPRARQRIASAQAAVGRAAKLTQHLLAFARRQPLAPEAIDTARLLTGMEELLSRALGSGMTLEVRVPKGLWPVRADPGQLENAVLNLCINARDAIRARGHGAPGTISVKARNAIIDDDFAAAHPDAIPGQYVLISISDTGIGMTPEQAARAVEPFFTTKPVGEGTGLGLSMVYGFATQSGGHLLIDSFPGSGTTVQVYLPRTHAEPVAAQPAPALDRTTRTDGETVLIVEDDPAVRGAVTEAVATLGYKPIAAETAADGLALIEQGNAPDLLFTDVILPGEMSARDMAGQARALLPGLAVIFTSGYTADAIGHHGEMDADVHFLPKPWRIEELAQHLRAALDARGTAADHGSGRRILLVEDDMLVRATTADLLAAMGHAVTQVATAREALDALADGADILLTDFGLPDLDGRTLAARARTVRASIPVIIASGRNDVSLEGPGTPLPGRPPIWLMKPYDERALAEALGRAAATAA